MSFSPLLQSSLKFTNMTTKESSKELKELSEILADARTRLARLIPELVEHDIVDYHLSNVSLALSNLSRFSKNLAEISKLLEETQKDQLL